MVVDVNGLRIEKGDTVAPITGDFKGRVCAIKIEDGEGFVSIRASHRPYSKGVWYAADHVQRLQVAPDRREQTKKLFGNATKIKSEADTDTDTDGDGDGGTATTTQASTTTRKKTTKKSTKKRTTRKATTVKKKAPAKKKTTRKKAGSK